jgi:hypothetical protein
VLKRLALLVTETARVVSGPAFVREAKIQRGAASPDVRTSCPPRTQDSAAEALFVAPRHGKFQHGKRVRLFISSRHKSREYSRLHPFF